MWYYAVAVARICQMWRQPLHFGQKPIICQDFCEKLHENERNWTKVEAHIPSAPLDPPMLWSYERYPRYQALLFVKTVLN